MGAGYSVVHHAFTASCSSSASTSARAVSPKAERLREHNAIMAPYSRTPRQRVAPITLARQKRSTYPKPDDFSVGNSTKQLKALDHYRKTVLARPNSGELACSCGSEGIGRIGWHTFRHSHSTLLHALGVDLKVQQVLLRHADIRTTMNIYTDAVPAALREANSKVVRLVLPAQVA